MTVLTKAKLASRVKIEHADDPSVSKAKGWNATTYDSRVGEIITIDGKHDSDTYDLPPRGIAWLVSREDYTLPNNVTGITTLRTTWTKSGVMTLTSGIVDPGYSGPLSTAVINFSKVAFPISKGERFFRTIFLEHDPVSELGETISRDDYIKKVLKNRAKADKTFLTFESFEKELQERIFQLPRLAFIVTAIGLALGLATLIIPGITGWTQELRTKQAQVQVLEGRIERVESAMKEEPSVATDANRLAQIERRLAELESSAETPKN